MSETFGGVNLWQAMWWGALDPARLDRELDRLSEIGVTMVRIVASSEGPDDAPHRIVPSLTPTPGAPRPALMAGLRRALDALDARGLGAIVCLGNFWHWTGGFAQLRSWCDGTAIPYPTGEAPDWNAFGRYAAGFYESPEAVALFDAHVATVVDAVAAHPATRILEVANEPRGMHLPARMRQVVHRTVETIRARTDKPITLGSEGSTARPDVAGLDFHLDHDHPEITHTTIHLWPENWGFWDPIAGDDEGFETMLDWARGYVRAHAERARDLDRPLIVEELGLSRDGGARAIGAGTTRRDSFFRAIVDEVERARHHALPIAGVLFWAWAGETLGADGPWRPGAALGGDPPHEPQGWYGISAADSSTHQIVGSVGQLARPAPPVR